jgi:MFS transporter, ACS family, D-galactonate transporter
MVSSTVPAGAAPVASHSRRRTELDRYPGGGQRYLCLGIVVLATIVLYYQFYLAGAVAAGTNGKNGILVDTHMSFVYYVNIAVVGYILGAVASFVTGVADRFGRVNIVTIGLVIVGLLCLLGIPLADSKVGFALVFGAIGLVEGVILVATPALIRDFSPQLGRASAMGFWTLGPVLGSLVVSIQISNTSNTTPWHDQYIASGVVGLVVAALSFVFLRELTPELRDQLMVSARDRALIEARAKGIDVQASMKRPFRQMLKADIVLSAFAISVFLIIYYVAVGFFPVYFQTVFGFTQTKANALGNWMWAFDAGALLVIGYLSDKVRVRKPFMVIGAIGAIVMTVLFALRSTHAHTSYSTFVVLLSLLAVFLGVAYAPWMASFTETVEKRNPALAATGLAVWGLVIRLVIAVSVFIVPHVVNTVSTLVEKGPQAQALAAKYAGPLGAAAKVDPATLAQLTKDPTNQAAGVKAISEITKVPASDIVTIATVSASHKAALAAAQKVNPATLAALGKNPADASAGAQAVSQISGVPVAQVATIATLNAQHGPAIAAAQVVDQATITALVLNPKNATAGAKAVQEVVSKLHITAADAQARLQDLTAVPVTQLQLLQTSGPKVVAAEAALKDLATIPPAQLQLLQTSGPKVATAQAQLVALGKIPAKDVATLKQAQKASAASPKQWRNYFWIAVGGEVVFIPLIFLLTGYWSPRRARKQEQEHEAWVEAELAKLGS